MEEFLNTISSLQKLYRELMFFKLDVAVGEDSIVKYEEEKKKIIENMKPVAKILKEEYKLDEFDFSDNEKFYESVKKFLSRVD